MLAIRTPAKRPPRSLDPPPSLIGALYVKNVVAGIIVNPVAALPSATPERSLLNSLISSWATRPATAFLLFTSFIKAPNDSVRSSLKH